MNNATPIHINAGLCPAIHVVPKSGTIHDTSYLPRSTNQPKVFNPLIEDTTSSNN